MDFHPATAQLFGSVQDGGGPSGGGSPVNYLGTIDLTDGT
jgi:hypothetical protein